jgi:hypothetical protein
MDTFKLPKRLAQMIDRSHCCMTEFIQEGDEDKPERFGKTSRYFLALLINECRLYLQHLVPTLSVLDDGGIMGPSE